MASASAKLRALDMNKGGFHDPLVRQTLYSALPAIIALVEAVEKEWEGDFASGEVGNALSALSQALGGK